MADMHLPVSTTDLRSLVDRGRRSGLHTGELYRALASRLPRAGEVPGRVDANGFVPVLDPQSHPSFKPDLNRRNS
jgi:hypothetical protein